MSAAGRMKIGVITNPGSQQNKAGLAEVTELLNGEPAVDHAVLEQVGDIPEILRDFARREVGLVTVAGGDGTVQATLTELFGSRPFATPPLLAVMPRGMTNLIAADVGLRHKGLRGLKHLLTTARHGNLAPHVVARQILRVENAHGQPPLYGMFFGGAGIPRAIDVCLKKVHPLNIKADSAVAVTLAGLLLSWLLHRRRGGGTGETIFYGDRIGLAFDNEEPETMERLVILATTLDRLILGSRPFWGGRGDLRFTSIAYPPRRMLRYAWRILYGRENRRLPPESYLSRSVARVALAMDCPFTLDGEMYEPAPGRDVVLTAADEARFVRL